MIKKNLNYFLVLSIFIFIGSIAYAKKTSPQYTEGLLKKNCYQTKGSLKTMSAIKRDKLCSCIAKKVFERLRKPTDLSDASKRMILEKSNTFFTNPQKQYNEDPLNIIDELFNYTDSCHAAIDTE